MCCFALRRKRRRWHSGEEIRQSGFEAQQTRLERNERRLNMLTNTVQPNYITVPKSRVFKVHQTPKHKDDCACVCVFLALFVCVCVWAVVVLAGA